MSKNGELPVVPPVIPGVDPEKMLECVHCGICLSACPTYDILGTEADSPRGRIYLMRSVLEGRAELDETVVKHLDACLGCRACETACPSAVPYEHYLTAFRDEIERRNPRPVRDRVARRLLLDLLTNPGRLAPMLAGARLTRGVLGSGPMEMANRFLFGPHAPSMPLPDRATFRVRSLPKVTAAVGERRARVALLAGCVMQVMFQRINEATLRVLAANGVEVLVQPDAGCCGALHMHNGFLEDARARARRLMEALDRQEIDAVVINSAGCGSALKSYGELFHQDPAWSERAEKFAGRIRDVTEFLTELGPLPPPRPVPLRLAYHDACHLAHGQGVRAQPRDLLRSIPELELVEISHSDWCCGSAGIYNFLQPEMASQLQEKKVSHVLEAEPEAVATGNPGCHAWIEAGLRGRGSQIPVYHTMEVLDRAYANDSGSQR
jgi:glycolate oxidase iron-sulfur subunit